MIRRKPGQPCQVASRYHDVFICDHRESGGYQCESFVPDHGENHWWSMHTIQHSIAGNGWSCGPVAEGTTPDQDEAICRGDEYFAEYRLDPQEHPLPFGIRDTVGILRTSDRSEVAYADKSNAKIIVDLLNKEEMA